MSYTRQKRLVAASTASSDMNSSTSGFVDLNGLCRMCAQPCGATRSFVVQGSMLAQRLRLYLNIQIEKDPELPRHVCQPCRNSLDSWANVFEKVRRSQSFFYYQLQLRRSQPQFPQLLPTPQFVTVPKEEPLTEDDLSVDPTFSVDPMENLECDICKKKFINRDELTAHSTEHDAIQILPSEPTGNFRRILPKENMVKIVTLPSVLQTPKKRGRPKSIQKKLKVTPLPKAQQKKGENFIPCGNCDFFFNEIEHLESHIKDKHRTCRMFKCGLCAWSYKDYSDLITHVNDHKTHPEKYINFKCQFCEKVFRYKSNVSSHIMHYHKNTELDSDNYSCGMCKNEFLTLEKFTEHLNNEHSNLNELDCSQCEEKFSLIFQLVDHEKGHRVEGSFQCRECVRSFDKERNLAAHIRRCHQKLKLVDAKQYDLSSFTDPTSSNFNVGVNKNQEASNDHLFQCGTCNGSFYGLQNFAKHFQNAHENYYELPCGICEAKFTKLPSLLNHEQTHKNFPARQISFLCPYCQKSISAPRHLKLHIETFHPQMFSSSSFQCDKCPENFTIFSKFINHNSSHSEVKCPLCYTLVSHRKNLPFHLKTSHSIIKSRERNTPCPICGKMFRSNTTMKVHMDLHSTTRNFVCEICARSYRSLSALHKHKQTHSKPKLMCDLCTPPRPFTFKNALKKHIMLHINYLPYVCKICDRGFVGPTGLRQHKLKKHTKGFGYNCIKCNKQFKDPRHWRRHMATICNVPMDQIPYTRDRQFIKYPKVFQPSTSSMQNLFYQDANWK